MTSKDMVDVADRIAKEIVDAADNAAEMIMIAAYVQRLITEAINRANHDT